MTHNDYRDAVEALKRVTNFDDNTVELLASTGRSINIPAGWAVMVQNTPPDKAYILLEGDVEIRREDAVLARLSAGDVVGELAILNGKLRSATVVAVTRVRALHFTDEEFTALIAKDPGFADRLLEGSVERLG